MKYTAKNNKLLAKFLGVKVDINGEYEMFGVIPNIDQVDQHFYTPEEMLFRSDWNWMIAVIDKINDLDGHKYQVEVYPTICRIRGANIEQYGNTMLDAVYFACVTFIEQKDEIARLVDVGMIDLIKAVQAGLPDFDGDFGGMLDIHIEDIKDDLVNLIAEAVENGK